MQCYFGIFLLGRVETLAKELEEKAKAVKDAEETGNNRMMPRAFARLKDRVARLDEAKSRLEAEQAVRSESHEEHVKERETKERQTGKKLRGRKPKAVQAKPEESAKANPTDPDSRIMKTRKGFAQGFNGQLVVSEDQIILAAEVVNEANDQAQFEPMMEKAEAAVAALCSQGQERRIEAATADAGYNKAGNLAVAMEKPYAVHIALEKDHKQRKDLGQNKLVEI